MESCGQVLVHAKQVNRQGSIDSPCNGHVLYNIFCILLNIALLFIPPLLKLFEIPFKLLCPPFLRSAMKKAYSLSE